MARFLPLCGVRVWFERPAPSNSAELAALRKAATTFERRHKRHGFVQFNAKGTRCRFYGYKKASDEKRALVNYRGAHG